MVLSLALRGYAPYMFGVNERIHKVLITRDPDGSPNTGPPLDLANSCFNDLRDFLTHDLTSICS